MEQQEKSAIDFSIMFALLQSMKESPTEFTATQIKQAGYTFEAIMQEQIALNAQLRTANMELQQQLQSAKRSIAKRDDQLQKLELQNKCM